VQPVERTDPEGVDYGWVMQTTFVVTIVVGAPVVALFSTQATLSSWGARAAFAIRIGAPIWFLTAVAVFAYARRTGAGDGTPAGEGADGDDPTDGTASDGGTAEAAATADAAGDEETEAAGGETDAEGASDENGEVDEGGPAGAADAPDQ